MLDVLGGEYRIGNNIWGGTTAQEVTAHPDQTYFKVTRSEHNQDTVAAYPFIFKGVHFGDPGTKNSGFPIQVSNVASAPFSWRIDKTGAGGEWNAAFEAFFSSKGGTEPDKAELMIWIDKQGPYHPGGTLQGTVTIGGLTWNVYHQSPWGGGWEHYIAYQLVTPAASVNLDFKDFIADSLARGYLKPEWYLDNMEAGFEIWSGGQGLTTKSFSAQVVPVAAGKQTPGQQHRRGAVQRPLVKKRLNRHAN